jgi:hypothetical protein
VIPADKTVVRLEAAKPFTPKIPGWFVPDARMQEIIARGLVATATATATEPTNRIALAHYRAKK